MINPPPRNPDTPDPARRNYSPLLRPVYFAGGVGLTGLGVIGAFLPVMPTTIFLILAAYCFARSSPRLENWIMTHPKYGPPVAAWRQNGAIPRRIKFIAISMMTVSFVIVAITHPPTLWLTVTGLVLLACAVFVASRPIGPKVQN